MPNLDLYARAYVVSLDTGNNLMPYGGRLLGYDAPSAGINAVIRQHRPQYIYDFQSLSIMLKAAGFRKITHCEFR
jgi:hypothetical protein